jgi:arabinogalactan endo-1,4-beta-galactosidase
MGWELGAKNYVSNTTLFGYEGNRLEVLDAFKYNN